MSLKDRFNTVQKQAIVKPQEQEKKQVKEEVIQEIRNKPTVNLGVLESLLIDDELNNIFVNGARNICTEKRGKINRINSSFKDDAQLAETIINLANAKEVNWSEDFPYIKFNYKQGINIQATLPPISDVISMNVKCFSDRNATILKLQEELSISKEIAMIFEAFCSINKNILITGKKGTLKTTLLAALAKKIPNNNKVCTIDTENEFKSNPAHYTTYNFSDAKNDVLINELIDFVLNSEPDKLIVNTSNEDLLINIIDKIEYKKGLITALQASTPEKAIEKLSNHLIRKNPTLSKEEAKARVLSAFDIIIHTQKDETGRRKVVSISEFNPLSEKELVQDIFSIEYSNQHKSTGVTPLFFDDMKSNSLPISDNIFDINYKHTYFSSTNMDKLNNFDRKTAKLNILRKFKKELPTTKDEIINEAQLEEEILASQEENTIQEEQTAQIQEQEITQQEENLSENQNENL